MSTLGNASTPVPVVALGRTSGCEIKRPEITLIRHGQTEWSKSGKHTGLSDVALTELGRRQGLALGKMLEGAEFDRVWSSPLGRASTTMELAGLADAAETNPDLVEWDYGEYEGISTAEVREEIPGWTIWTHPVNNGERIEQVGDRADRVIADLLDIDGTVAIFGHGHFSRILAARWTGHDAVEGRRLALSTATVSKLGWERETRVIRSWNIECHLPSYDPLP